MMSNLENLTQKIIEEAKSQASIIEKESKKANEKIIDSKTREAEEEKKRMLSRANSEANLLRERTISNAELKARNKKLEAKQEVIGRSFDTANERLKNFNADKYLSYLQSKIKSIKFEGGESIIVQEAMKSKVEELGLDIKVSDDEFVESGFSIQGKGTRLNYTFESLIEQYRDELETEIAKSLFKE